ncbi:Uncharacterised protein [Mesomycoplasma dispar]|uniref:Transmembrane protein n=1 Tax=Mesomycoplasma dispar TaxID=86660 RepID=A0AAJ5NQ79_9BACT|nr:hypothetical protein [Mesomycoplasma dispar]AJR12209.1 hypothetical protein MDIS_02085 [Mesomycoplasma dispar]VEU61806.1 Uncharacterised protein [Mesomycoplasma dispar]
MNWNQDQSKQNPKNKETKQPNFFIPRNPNQNNSNKNQNSNFASRDRNYQQYNNFQKTNYAKEQKFDNPNPFEGEVIEKTSIINKNELEAQNSPEYYSQPEDSSSYSNHLKNNRQFQETYQSVENNNKTKEKQEKSKKTAKIPRQNLSNLLHEDENQFFNFLADAKSVVELTDLNSKMSYREQHTNWINSFYHLNSEIFQKHEKSTKKKLNIIEKLWNNISLTGKSVYYTIATLLISLLMLVFWLIFAGFNNFTFWQYAAFVGSFAGFLIIVQLLVYFNNSKNRQKSQKIIFYYVADSSFLLINYLVRLVFLLSPLFADKLIVFNQNQDISQLFQTGGDILSSTNEYTKILHFIALFPSISYFLGLCFFIPLKWSQFVNNFWLIFGIFKVFSYLNLVKEYRARNNDDNLQKKLNSKWVNLYKIGRPLTNSFHPAFLYAFKVIKTNPNLPISEQDKLVSYVFNSVNNDIVKYR